MYKLIQKTLILIAAMLMPAAAMAYTADEVLATAAKKANAAKSITAKFTGSASGTLTVSGSRFSMVAGGFGIWYDGHDMWTYSKRAGETSLTTPTQSELLETNPMEIIKGYSSRFTAQKVSQTGSKYTVKLTPKTKNVNIRTATLVINTSTWMPESIDIVFSNDSRMTVNITSITEGAVLPASAFAYPAAKYPGIEVVDLR